MADPPITDQSPRPVTERGPRGTPGSMTRAEWREAILEDLGGEGVDVELSEEQLDFCLKRALGLWAKHRPFLAWFPFEVQRAESVYIDFARENIRSLPALYPDTFVRNVLDVVWQDRDRASLGVGSVDTSGNFLRWGYEGPRLFFEYQVAERTYERLTGSRPGWFWDSAMRRLYLSSPGREVRAMVLTSRPRLIEEIPPDHEDDFLQAAVARAKRISARVLGARGPIPGAAGAIETDARELRSEAQQEWTEVRERLERSLSSVPPPRYIG